MPARGFSVLRLASVAVVCHRSKSPCFGQAHPGATLLQIAAGKNRAIVFPPMRLTRRSGKELVAIADQNQVVTRVHLISEGN